MQCLANKDCAVHALVTAGSQELYLAYFDADASAVKFRALADGGGKQVADVTAENVTAISQLDDSRIAITTSMSLSTYVI